MIKIIKGDVDELGVPCGYVNEKGDTIIPIGKYLYCYTDTIKTFGIVGHKGETFALLGINQKDSVLFEVYWFDNGPDYPRDGLFRIIWNDKIGYADSLGQIVIEPQFKCANPFENRRARVALDCKVKVRDVDGHGAMVSDSWFYIDTNGNRIN
ncbi:MAG TPA: WG repeat-containing protein [Cyclobacteriaceae bacterium]|nr:WG repeat-containing protein [Cyclobacteriaceae bacterium]